MSKLPMLQNKLGRALRLTTEYIVVGSAAATAANHPLILWVAPVACRVMSVRARYSAAGGSGATITLRKAASGTAMGSGTNFWSVDCTQTANATYTGTLVQTANANVLNTGDAIGATTAGTLTGLADFVIAIEFQPLEMTDFNRLLGV